MSMPIISKNYDGVSCTLRDATTKRPIHSGAQVTLSDGERMVVTGGRAPHKPSSSGKVWVRPVNSTRGEREYFTPIIGAEWAVAPTTSAKA